MARDTPRPLEGPAAQSLVSWPSGAGLSAPHGQGAPRHSEESLSGNGTDQERPPYQPGPGIANTQQQLGANWARSSSFKYVAPETPYLWGKSTANERLHIQKQIIINGILSSAGGDYAFSLFTLKARSETQVPLPSDDERRRGGLRAPMLVFKRLPTGESKSRWDPVISATTCGTSAPGGPTDAGFLQGEARRRLGDGRGPDSKLQDSEQQNEAH